MVVCSSEYLFTCHGIDLHHHILSIFGKLGIASRHELSAIAYGTGFVEPEV